MKYCILIGDGMADEPNPRLSGRTPLEAAKIPRMDALASQGHIGLLHSSPPKMEPGSDVCNMTILGYDPATYHTGRAPLEAMAVGLRLGPSDLVFRCNLITTYDNLMADNSGGHISTAEAHVLIEYLNEELNHRGVEFVSGNSYRNLMLAHDLCELELRTTPPHSIPGCPIDEYLPSGRGSAELIDLMFSARELLEGHEVNVTRRDLGENPANMIWLWGQGRMPQLPRFEERFGIRGAAISAVDIVRGLAAAVDWTVIEVPGITGYTDTNYRGKADAALVALEDHDLVYVHVEAPDEVSHEGDITKKIKAIEAIDRHVLGPIRDGIGRFGDFRLAVMPDHATSLLSRTHVPDPVPFAVIGSGIPASGSPGYSEATAARNRRRIKKGADWMGMFLHTGFS